MLVLTFPGLPGKRRKREITDDFPGRFHAAAVATAAATRFRGFYRPPHHFARTRNNCSVPDANLSAVSGISALLASRLERNAINQLIMPSESKAIVSAR